MSAAFRLETPRLVLRPLRDDDAPLFAAYRSDPEVARYQSWEAPYPLLRALEFIEHMQDIEPGLPGEWCQVAIALQPGEILIGDCAFGVLKEDSRQAEIGFTLARAYQGQGYMSEAVGRLLEYLFGELKLHRVRANCDPQNHPSYRLLERLGFRREGHMVESLWFKGRWASELWYAILDREFEARSSG